MKFFIDKPKSYLNKRCIAKHLNQRGRFDLIIQGKRWSEECCTRPTWSTVSHPRRVCFACPHSSIWAHMAIPIHFIVSIVPCYYQCIQISLKYQMIIIEGAIPLIKHRHGSKICFCSVPFGIVTMASSSSTTIIGLLCSL